MTKISIEGKIYDLDRKDEIKKMLSLWEYTRDHKFDHSMHWAKISICLIGGSLALGFTVTSLINSDVDGNIFWNHYPVIPPMPLDDDYNGVIEMGLRGISNEGPKYRVKKINFDGGKTFQFSNPIFSQIPWYMDREGHIVVSREEDVMRMGMAL